jgi:hypothetical protein
MESCDGVGAQGNGLVLLGLIGGALVEVRVRKKMSEVCVMHIRFAMYIKFLEPCST